MLEVKSARTELVQMISMVSSCAGNGEDTSNNVVSIEIMRMGFIIFFGIDSTYRITFLIFVTPDRAIS